MTKRPLLDLFVVSLLILFLELACIRWFPAHVVFLSFFTNMVMLACFVGMSIGCLIANHPTDYLRQTPIRLGFALASGLLVEHFHTAIALFLSVGDQANPDVVFFGTETNALNVTNWSVAIEVVAGIFYFLIALVFVGPGQALGRAFEQVASRSAAYTVNLLGSVIGILVFAGFSTVQLPPPVWFGLCGLCFLYLFQAKQETKTAARAFENPLVWLLVCVACSVVTSGWFDPKSQTTIWSPYYRVRMTQQDLNIDTNLISHQRMHPVEDRTSPVIYDLPYLFARETGRPMPKRILIIGAGSGNDVSRALKWAPKDAHIDAVEIDPVIRKLGGIHHPSRPYDSEGGRLTTHLADGRQFLRNAPAGEYDLVVFALVDSLVLHSGASSIRLESFLFTKESFEDVARVLKPDGQVAVYNFFRQGWIVARVRETLRGIFGAEPVILTDPPREKIRLATADEPNKADAIQSFTAMYAGREAAIRPLHEKFDKNNNCFWIPRSPTDVFFPTATFGSAPPFVENPDPLCALIGATAGKLHTVMWPGLRKATVDETNGQLHPATDDWPFLYVKSPAIPAQTWKGILLTVVISFLVWKIVSSGNSSTKAGSLDGERGLVLRSFLLGAGFMLIETKALVQMALLAGSTWVVNNIVFTSVLLMSLVGNLLASRMKGNVMIPYLGLFAAIGVGIALPVGEFLGSSNGGMAASCAVAFAPVAFAGIVFASTFARSKNPDLIFGANVAGAIVGGLLENLSIVVGFRLLLCVAGVLYLLSALAVTRNRAPEQKGN